MSLGQRVIDYIETRRQRNLYGQPGPIGEFYRAGGNQLLYDLPVETGGLIIDAGGYEGDWSAGMIARYGCKAEIYEAVPAFANNCANRFRHNRLVSVHPLALGNGDKTVNFNLHDSGTSSHREGGETVSVQMIDVARIFECLLTQRVQCLKLNIEGGEYDVLERLIQCDYLDRCESLLIQFHRQPEGYQGRYDVITKKLSHAHRRAWGYDMVWELWLLRAS